MKKTTTLSFLILFFAITAFAAPVDPEKALEIANSFSKSIPELKQCELLLLPVGPSKSAERGGAHKADAQYYLFAPEDKGGFVIVSGEDRLAPVVGYSTGTCAGDMPPALVDWLAEYSNFVDDVRAGVIEPAKTASTAGTKIEPMLKTSWNQSTPYNNYCPEINGQKTPTGCTATATAQVMKFHEWPEKPTKAISWDNNITGKKETIDITKNTYEWNNMLSHYRNGYTAEQAHAVAQLMVDVGKAMGSNYALAGTGSSEVAAARALVKVFDYSPDIQIYKRNECTYDEFISIIRENLEARQPLVYTGHGQSYAAGHAFVCDGIDENNLVHIDWGWDGSFNGFFDIGSMAPGGTGIGGGQDRYNVGQSIIANIKPRGAEETGRTGDPTIYQYEVINETNNNAIVEEHISKFVSGNAHFRTMVQFLNWSHSTAKLYFGTSITSVDGTFSKVNMESKEEVIALDKAIGYYIDFKVHNSNKAHADYLKEGTYYVEIVYKVGNAEPVKMKGENNRLVLEVGKTSAKLSKAQPAIEVSGFKFRTVPQTQEDKMVFDVAFRNNNTNNAAVVVVPIVNRLKGDDVVKSDTLVSNGVLINVFDNTDFLATYTLNNAFSGSGDHYVSFAYDLRNSYNNHDLTVDKKMLKSIAGKSGVFVVGSLPDGPLPTVSSISATASTVGAVLTLSATVKNVATTNSKYSGTLGLFVEKGGKAVMLAEKDVNLAKGGATQIKFSGTGYVPLLDAGTYEAYVCELAGGEWKRIRQSNMYNFVLKAPVKSVLYAANRIVIGDDDVAAQGDSVDVIAGIGCMGVDFEGYLRVNVLDGIKAVLRSEYIPVSIRNGEVVDVNLRSICGSEAKPGEWKFTAKYYDANKRELGTVSNNSLTYPENDYFWVADATAIEDTVAEGAIVVAGDGCITVGSAVSVKVFSLDGRCVCEGNVATVTVEKGVYIVAAENSDGSVTVTKVLVK